MFVMTEEGKLFVFRINEITPEQSDFFSKKRPQFTGEILLDQPIFVKDLPPLKMIAAGLDHLICLDRKGQVHAMGDDTFG